MKLASAAITTRATIFLLAGCEVEQTEEGKMPQVDVEGNLPEYKVDTPKVDIGTQKQEVEVPDVDVDSQTETITVPDVDIKSAEESSAEEENR